MAFTPRSAKNAKVRIGAATFTAKVWNVVNKSDKLDTTNFESGGYETSTFGIESAEVSIEADWDGAANPFDSPPALTPGASVSTVKLYLNDTTGPYWSFPTLNLFEANCTANVRETLKISIKGSGHGTFVRPTGAA